MAEQYVVKAGGVVARVAGSDRYLERGAVLPDGVENLDHLKSVGLVSVVEVEDEVPASVDDMKLDQLKAYAKEREIELNGATKKDDVLAAIKAAEATPQGDGDGDPDNNNE